MSDRKWTNSICFAYSYIFFAYCDGEYADEEAVTLYEKLTEWWPDEDKNVFFDACKTAENWLLEDYESGGADLVYKNARMVANWLNNFMDDNMNDPEVSKRAFLKDLMAIAKADNKFMESEKDSVRLYADALGLSVEIID